MLGPACSVAKLCFRVCPVSLRDLLPAACAVCIPYAVLLTGLRSPCVTLTDSYLASGCSTLYLTHMLLVHALKATPPSLKRTRCRRRTMHRQASRASARTATASCKESIEIQARHRGQPMHPQLIHNTAAPEHLDLTQARMHTQFEKLNKLATQTCRKELPAAKFVAWQAHSHTGRGNTARWRAVAQTCSYKGLETACTRSKGNTWYL